MHVVSTRYPYVSTLALGLALPFLPCYVSWYLFVLWSLRAAQVEHPERTRGVFQTPSLSRPTRPVALLS